MTESILIGVGWPFPNGSLHLGQIAGAYLPPDIFARYQRAAGNNVAMVSGTDQHGTPIVVRAELEGKTPQEVVDYYHAEFLQCWQDLGITFDCYTSTGTENHIRTAQDMFLRLFEQGNIYPDTMELTYCELEQRFLPDRYVEGTCPYCGYEAARGDQCDNCGRTLDPTDLINPRCAHDGSTPVRRESEHFFLRLSAYTEQLRQWLSEGKEHWRKPVLNFSVGVLNEGLRDRAITRDLTWGVPIPLEGYQDKRIYVWFENVIGYLSAAKELAQRQGKPEAWRDFWEDPDAKIYYFVGKDNIWFHTLSWPAQVMMNGGLNQPYDVPANQYLNFSGAKASTSRGTAPFLPDYLERYDPDAIRYYLSAIMPETGDSEFSEEDLIRRNNEELVSTWGNLVNRVLTITYRTFGGKVPEPGELTEKDRALLDQGERALAAVGESLNACRFREALRAAMSYAQEANRYLNQEEPWKTRESDPAAAARSLYTAIGAIETLKLALYPYLPFTSQRLHELLGHSDAVDAGGWRTRLPEAGTRLQQPEPLFKKLDPPGTGAERVIELFDSHAHLQEPEFERDIEQVIKRARVVGVAGCIVPAADIESAESAIGLAGRFEGIYATAGYHPHDAGRFHPDQLTIVEELLSHPKVVAVGEIGLDFFRMHSSREAQMSAFNAMLTLAEYLTMPVVVHCRDAWEALSEQLVGWASRAAQRFGRQPLGVLHYFTGSLEDAERYVGLGFLISVHTSVTHPKAIALRDVMSRIPLESLVVETDSPYGAPQAFRGARNEPAYVVEAAKQIAEVKGLSLQEVAEATTANARRLFRLPVATGTPA